MAGTDMEGVGQEEQGAGTMGEWQGLSVSPQQQDLTGPACTGTGRPEKRKLVRAIPIKINLMLGRYDGSGVKQMGGDWDEDEIGYWI